MRRNYITLPVILLTATSLANAETYEPPLEDCDKIFKERNITKEETVDLEKLFADGKERSRLPPSEKGEWHVISAGGIEKIIIKEDERNTQIAEDLATLTRILLPLPDLQKFVGLVGPRKSNCFQFDQKLQRSTMNVKASFADGQPEKEHKFIAGPAEHLYLSADLSVNSIKQISFNGDNKSLVEKNKPASFYIGLNYKFGDLYTNYPYDKFYKDISAKLLLKASSKPNQSMGVGFAYNLKYADIFIARIWTKNDAIGETNSGTTPTTVFGLSFNITKGLSWMKDDKK